MLLKSPRRRSSRFVTAVAFTASALLGYPSIYAQQPVAYPSIQNSYQPSAIPVQEFPVIQHGTAVGTPYPIGSPVGMSCNACQPCQPMSFPAVTISTTNIYPSQLPSSYAGDGIIVSGPVTYRGEVIIDSGYPLEGTIISETPVASSYLPQTIGQAEVILAEGQIVDGPALDPPTTSNTENDDADVSPSDIPLLETGDAETEPDPELKSQLDAKSAKVEQLQTVVGELKVELRSTNERLYATERAAKAKEQELNSKLADAEQEIKALKKAKADAELTMKERAVDQEQQVQKVRLLEEKIQIKDKQIAVFQSQLNELQNLVAKEKAARLDVEKRAAVRAQELEVQQAEAAKLVAQQEAKLKAALNQVEAAQAQVRKARAQAQQAMAQPKPRAPKAPAGDARRRVEALKKAAQPEKKQDPFSNDRPKRDSQDANPEQQKADRNQKQKPKLDQAKSDNQPTDKGKRKLPGNKFEPDQQIAKLERTMKRQIENAQQASEKELKKTLNELGKEGIGKSHPRAKQAIEDSNAKLQERIEGIKNRVQQRIQRLKEEARRRAAS